MSLTVSQIIQDAQFETDDTGLISNTGGGLVHALRLINRGRKEILKDSLCLSRTYSLSSVTGQNKYSLASDFWKMKTLTFNQNGVYVNCYPVTLAEWNRFNQGQVGSAYSYYYVDPEGKINFSPLVDSAPTVTLDGGIDDVVTTIPVVSTLGIPTSGRVIIGSEVIFYNGTDATNLKYCTRGQEGTTAASHLTGATATLRNILYTYFYFPADVTTTASTVETPFEVYPDVLLYWVCWKLKQRDTDDVQSTGSNAQAMAFYQMYQSALNDMMYALTNDVDVQRTVRSIRKGGY